MMPPHLTPLKQVRQERILDIATQLFVDDGFRAVTIEAIAAAGGLSKVTLYSYFTDKDAVFQAVARRFAGQLEHSVSAAFAGSGPVSERIINGLWTKHRMVFDLVRRSSHARELFATNDRITALMFEELDRKIEVQIARLLRQDGLNEALSSQLARLLFAASHGIANQSEHAQTLEADLRLLVGRILAAG